MEQASSLGEGFVLANHDLEIRGAGEILGEEQSGHIQAIGFALYLRLLERAIDALKNNEDISDVFEQEDQMHLDIQMSGLLDSHYIENDHARLSVYKRLVSSDTMDEIANLQEEMRDRFGDIPENSMNLLNLSRLRSYLNRVGVKKLFANEKDGYLELKRRPRINPLKLREVAMKDRSKYEFNSPRSLRFIRDMPNDRARISFLLMLVIELSKPIDTAVLNS
jgi:transcription-repair coupling factor (superfamily II helicase)